jgi:hypothetical protein
MYNSDDIVLVEFKKALETSNLSYFEDNMDIIRYYFLKGFESENGSTVFDYLCSIKTEKQIQSILAILSSGIITPTMRAGGVCFYPNGNTLLEHFAHRKDDIGKKVYSNLINRK